MVGNIAALRSYSWECHLYKCTSYKQLAF